MNKPLFQIGGNLPYSLVTQEQLSHSYSHNTIHSSYLIDYLSVPAFLLPLLIAKNNFS